MSAYDMDIVENRGREWAFRGAVRVGDRFWQSRRDADEILRQLDIPAPGSMSTSRPTGAWGGFLFEGGRLYLRAILTYPPREEPRPSERWVLRRESDGFGWDWSRGGFWPKDDGYEYTLTEPLEVACKALNLYETSAYWRQEPRERLTLLTFR